MSPPRRRGMTTKAPGWRIPDGRTRTMRESTRRYPKQLDGITNARRRRSNSLRSESKTDSVSAKNAFNVCRFRTERSSEFSPRSLTCFGRVLCIENYVQGPREQLLHIRLEKKIDWFLITIYFVTCATTKTDTDSKNNNHVSGGNPTYTDGRVQHARRRIEITRLAYHVYSDLHSPDEKTSFRDRVWNEKWKIKTRATLISPTGRTRG